MAIHATAKSKISIGTTVAAANVATFAADTYVPISHVENMGEFGSEAEIISGRFVDAEFVRKLKGTRDNGTLTLVVGRDPADAGQTALRAAEATSFAYNVKVELNDKPSPAGTNTVFYFKAIIASARNVLEEADAITKTTFALAIDGPIYEVPADDA